MRKENRVTLNSLSEKTGISTSTLSRALNNCPGVDHETWQLARDAAHKYGYTHKTRRTAQVGILFPTVPGFFYRPALSAINQILSEYGIKRYMIALAHAATTEDICAHIDEMIENGVKILLMSVRSKTVTQYLNTLRDKITVFQICDYDHITNSFVFSSDGKKDGSDMAEFLLKRKSDCRVLLFSEDTVLSQARMEGFRSAFPKEMIVGDVSCSYVPQGQCASAYARLFFECCTDTPPDVIVCSGGILTYVAQAIIKCQWVKKTVCVGYENPPDLMKYVEKGIIIATTEQDIEGECKIAAKAAVDFLKTGQYPANKYNFLPGKVYIFDTCDFDVQGD